jgi:hypothetical protein
MSDVLDRLRADNPVSAGTAPPIDEVWARLDRDRRGPGRRIGLAKGLVLALCALAPVAVVVAIALGAGEGTPSPVAAGGSGAIVRYHALTVVSPAPASGASFRDEVDVADVWIRGAVRHRVETGHFYSWRGKPTGGTVRLEIFTDGRRLEDFEAGPLAPRGMLTEGRLASPSLICPLIVACGPDVSTDPVAEVRLLVERGVLKLVSRGVRFDQTTVNVLESVTPAMVVKVFVDARSGVPVEIAAMDGKGANRWVTTTRISGYRRLAPTAANLARLRMRAHPGARVVCSGAGGGGPVSAPAGRSCLAREGSGRPPG